MKKIDTKQMKFVDESKRERIFNGINLVYKGSINQETGLMTYNPGWGEEQFKWFQEKGFNLIRLGIIWDAVEHEMGIYNEDYLNWVKRMLDLCEKYGVYAFLDMHQDLYSCIYGDGAPEWATLTDGQPHVEGELWSDAYLFSGAVKRAYENFWDNKPAADGLGLQDHYANMWIHIVGKFKDHPALIGYDCLNEPFPGECGLEIFATLLGAYAQLTQKEISLEELVEIFSDPVEKHKLLAEFDDKELYLQMTRAAEDLLTVFDQTKLNAFYEKMTSAIRTVTENGIMMMENSYFSNLGIPCNISPIKDEKGNREKLQAYAPHGYDLVVDTEDIIYASNNRVDVIFDTHREVQERLDVPVIVGEWGAHSMYGKGLEHIEYLLEKFDNYKWSSTYWCYHQDIEKAPVISRLSRPYPQAICGEIIDYHYDRKNNSFTLNWEEIADWGTESMIYLHQKPKEVVVEGEVWEKSVSENASGRLLVIPNKGMGKRNLVIHF